MPDDQNDLDAKIANYTEAIRLNPADVLTYVARAWARRVSQGDLTGAIADYDEVIHLDPTNAMWFIDRAEMRDTLGDLAGAIADYTEAITLNPTDAWVLGRRGEAHFAHCNFTAARSDFEASLKINPEMKDALIGLPLTLHALGEVAEAQSRWRTLAELDRRYLDADWIGNERIGDPEHPEMLIDKILKKWRPELIAEARKLIASL